MKAFSMSTRLLQGRAWLACFAIAMFSFGCSTSQKKPLELDTASLLGGDPLEGWKAIEKAPPAALEYEATWMQEIEPRASDDCSLIEQGGRTIVICDKGSRPRGTSDRTRDYGGYPTI